MSKELILSELKIDGKNLREDLDIIDQHFGKEIIQKYYGAMLAMYLGIWHKGKAVERWMKK